MPWSAWASSMPWAMPARCSSSSRPTWRGVVRRRDQLDVDRALGGAGGEVLVGDVAVVLRGADDAGGVVVGAQEVQEVAPGEACRPAEKSPSGSAMPLRCARRRTSSGVAVPSRWTCSSAFGTAATASTALIAGPRRRAAGGRGRLPHRDRGADRGGRRVGSRLIARVDDRQRPAAGATAFPGPATRPARRPGRSRRARPRRPAAEVHDRDAQARVCRARSRRRRAPGRPRGSPARDRRCCSGSPSGRVGRPGRRPSRRSTRPRRRRPARPPGSASASPPSSSSARVSASVTASSRGSAVDGSRSSSIDSRTSSALPAVVPRTRSMSVSRATVGRPAATATSTSARASAARRRARS